MRKFSLLLLSTLLIFSLCACTPSEKTTIPAETVLSADLPSPDETTVPAASGSEMDTAPDSDYFTEMALIPGYFAVSSIGQDGDVTFFGAPDPDNGYIALYDDHSGVFFWDNTTQSITWDSVGIYSDQAEYPAFYVSAALSGDTEDLLMLYLLEENISIAFRPAEQPETP